MKVSKLARARLGYALGLVALVAGAALEWGVGWALMLGGAATAVSFLVLFDVEDPDPPVTRVKEVRR